MSRIRTVDNMPWVVTQLSTGLFGLNCSQVKEMVMMPEVDEVPGVPDYVRGVINLRGSVLPLVDLRKRLGMPSSREEIEDLCALLEKRSHDHKHWLEELDASVREKRSFQLARDPHRCAFGRWYDTYQTDNILVSGFLKKFAAPHAAVHALANEVEALIEKGCVDCAFQMLDQARSGVLSTMLGLFAQLQQTIRDTHREIALVLHGDHGPFAVSVDSVASVERLAAADMEPLAGKGIEQQSALVTSVAKRPGKSELILILAPESILDSAVLRRTHEIPTAA